MIQILRAALCAVVSLGAAAAEFADDGGSGGLSTSTGSYIGTRSNPVATAGEMKCLLQQTGTDASTAQTAAENIAQGMQIMNFDTSKMTRTCLLHFLAQIKAESAAGKSMTEAAPKSAASTGYGYIQVTGADNLRAAEKCMNEVNPGMGNGVSSNPEGTIGAQGNPLNAAVASLCWWRQNIINNNSHDSICKDSMDESDASITQIVNGGHVGAAVTGGMSNISRRQNTFSQLKAGDTQCRQYSI